MSEEPFGGQENFTLVMEDLVSAIAEFQVKYRLDFASMMALLKTTILSIDATDERILTIYGRTLSMHGMNHDGSDL